MKDIRYLVFHHSASGLNTTCAEIREWHLDKGWKDIGYSYVIESTGKLRVGRGLRTHLAANPPHNQDSIAVCIVGDNCCEGHEWTQASINTAQRLTSAITLLIPSIEVTTHREIGSTKTACPGMSREELIKTLGIETLEIEWR